MDYISAFTGGYNIWAGDSKGEIRWLRLSCDEKRLRAMLQTYLCRCRICIRSHGSWANGSITIVRKRTKNMGHMTKKIQRS